MRKMEINGTGAAAGRPDTVEIAIKFFDLNMNCAEALGSVKSRVSAFREKLDTLGLAKDELKTDDMSVEQQYDYQDSKKIFKGYLCRCSMNIDIPMENALLNDVLNEIAAFEKNATFSVGFTVKDKDSLAREALSAAVRDAVDKAELTAAAAGVKLGEIQEICPADFIRTEPRRNAEAVTFAMRASVPQPEYVPGDIKVNARVRIVWEII